MHMRYYQFCKTLRRISLFLRILKRDRKLSLLAYFKKRQEIKPAVYTIHKNKISYLNLRVETTYFQKIYLNENDLENYIRVFRIKNKSTTTQMLFFAYNIESLNIRFDSQPLSSMVCRNTIGKFYIYGIVEDFKNPYNSVNINGNNYSLSKTTVYQCFINAKTDNIVG